MSKQTIIFAALAIALLVTTGLFYFFYNNQRFSLDSLPFINQTQDFPVVTVAANEQNTGGMWVWLTNIATEQADGEVYLVGNLANSPKTAVRVLLGRENEEIGYATADTVPEELDSNFPNRYPTWTVSDIGNFSIETDNFNSAVVKIYTQQIQVPEDEVCDSICERFVSNLQLLHPENAQLVGDLDNKKQLTIGPAVQILLFKVTK